MPSQKAVCPVSKAKRLSTSGYSLWVARLTNAILTIFMPACRMLSDEGTLAPMPASGTVVKTTGILYCAKFSLITEDGGDCNHGAIQNVQLQQRDNTFHELPAGEQKFLDCHIVTHVLCRVQQSIFDSSYNVHSDLFSTYFIGSRYSDCCVCVSQQFWQTSQFLKFN